MQHITKFSNFKGLLTNTLPTNYSEDFEYLEREKDAEFIERSYNKHKDVPEPRKLRTTANALKLIAVIPQLFGGLLASAGVFIFCESFEVNKILCYIIAGMAFLLIEVLKRYSLEKTIEGFILPHHSHRKIFLAVLLPLIAISLWSTFVGGEKTPERFFDPAPTVYNLERDRVKTSIDSLGLKIAEYETQRWKGTIVRDARKVINQLQSEIAQKNERLSYLVAQDEAENKYLKNKDTESKKGAGFLFAIIGCFSDLLLFVFVFFAERCEKRAYMLARSPKPDQTNEPGRPFSMGRTKQPADHEFVNYYPSQRTIIKPFQNRQSRRDSGNDYTLPARNHKDRQRKDKPFDNAGYISQGIIVEGTPEALVKQLRENWATSFKNHSRAPKTAQARLRRKEKAEAIKRHLENNGYAIEVSKESKYKLSIIKP